MEDAVSLLTQEINSALKANCLGEDKLRPILKTLPQYPAYHLIFKLSFDEEIRSRYPEIPKLAEFIRKEFLWGDGNYTEKEFILVHAQFARRRADGMEVEFIGRHELRYHGPVGDFLFHRDGEDIELPRNLSQDKIAQLIADLKEASVPLKTTFPF